MDERHKCKTRNYKTLRGKHRTLDDINQSNISYDPPPRVMEIKLKVNKWDLAWWAAVYGVAQSLT